MMLAGGPGDEQPAPEIPSFLIEYFLLGRTRPGAIERFIQDGGVATDVWLAFAAKPDRPQRVLVAPARGTSSTDVGYVLHRAIVAYREQTSDPESHSELPMPNVSPLESFVALTIDFDELVRVLLPLTTWWEQTRLSRLRGDRGESLQAALSNAILRSLGQTLGKDKAAAIQELRSEDRGDDRRVLDAAPLAALIGLFVIARKHPDEIRALRVLAPSRFPEDRKALMDWIHAHATEIANEWREELKEGGRVWPTVREVIPPDIRERRRPLIDRVFLDRQASLASEANCSIKADAAKRVFDVSCRGLTWAVIDSGISTDHPAFIDHYTRSRQTGNAAAGPPPRRIRKTLDFTKIHLLRNFDLMAVGEDDRSRARRQRAVDSIVAELKGLPGANRQDPAFEALARENLMMIGVQLAKRLPPDWNLVEPLITITGGTDEDLPSDHGTHVAGILGADWRDSSDKVILQGVCPDIDLYDLRVVDRTSVEHTEFAVLSALEYVQFVNARAGSNGPLIHGVNISMSIPHKVRSYGCGSTPACVASDRLVAAGVVVVAAAGNRGWNEMELGFGNFVSSSITDPGNAREVITVGSTHAAKPHVYGVSFFSSRGPTGDGRIKPDLVAPGEKILGPFRGESDGELDGTSQATPFVSGAAAMLMSRHRELIGDPQRVKQILLDSATDLRRERYFQGHGLVDVLRAMQSI
jgi:serine protease AprX